MVRKLMPVLLAAVGLAVSALTPSVQAGAVGGPKGRKAVVRAFATDTYVVRFVGGELAMVGVEGDGDTDLDLYVYDETGKLVVADEDDTDLCLVRWTPRWTGTFTIRVVNRGAGSNRYTILTN
jgi:hypothetical protein